MSSREKPVTVYGAIAANFIIAVSKFAAGFITGSSAMLSEGIHSLVDTGNECLLLLGIHRGKKPADEIHPFGYGKEIYFWSLIVAVVLFAMGGGMSIYEGIVHLTHPERIHSPIWNYIVLGIAFAAEGVSWSIAFKKLRGKRKKDSSYLKALRASKDPAIFVVLYKDDRWLRFRGSRIRRSSRSWTGWLTGLTLIVMVLLVAVVGAGFYHLSIPAAQWFTFGDGARRVLRSG
jgi:hypothetical protein